MPSGFQFFAGGHPVPNRDSFAAARAALALVREHDRAPTSSDEDQGLCIFLISGGASAMMELPLDEAISLDDTVELYRQLVHCGASIVEINCVRKHFSAVKGGRLAMAAAALPQVSLLLSDVPADRLDALSSGPTVPDPSTVADCRGILARFELLPKLPESLRKFFAGNIPETPKPGDLPGRSFLMADNEMLAQAAKRIAEERGFYSVIDNTPDDWPFDTAAEYLMNRLRDLRRVHGRVCLVSGGEVLVRVTSSLLRDDALNTAQGGRNQHFALHAATLITPEDGEVAILSAGSDGIDGNSPAAGAVVDQNTVAALECDEAISALEQFRSHIWLTGHGATITTGPTGNNLRDLRILLADSQ